MVEVVIQTESTVGYNGRPETFGQKRTDRSVSSKQSFATILQLKANY